MSPYPTSNRRRLAWVYLAGGLLGLAAAFTLLVEKIALLEDPTYVPTCSINPILSCGSVMSTPQAEAFGFPNPILGVAGFAIIATVGAALLAGAQLAPWFRWALGGGTSAAVVFIHWLVFQSLYRINALCPYCMVVWVVTIAVFWYTLLDLATSTRWAQHPVARRVIALASTYHTVWLTVWYGSIAAAIAERFWDYWVTVLT